MEVEVAKKQVSNNGGVKFYLDNFTSANVEEQNKERIESSMFHGRGSSNNDVMYTYNDIDNRKRRILSKVPIQVLNKDTLDAKRICLQEKIVQREEIKCVEVSDNKDLYFVMTDDNNLRTINGSNSLEPFCFSRAVVEAEKQNSCIDVVNDAQDIRCSTYNSEERKDHAGEQTADGFENKMEGDKYRVQLNLKSNTLYSENKRQRDLQKDFNDKERFKQTAEVVAKKIDLAPVIKRKNFGYDKVLVKFRGKMQLIQREEYDKIISKLKAREKGFASQPHTSNASHGDRVGRGDGKFNLKVDMSPSKKMPRPADLTESSNMYHNYRPGIVPESENFYQMYPLLFTPNLAQTGSASGGKETERMAVDGMAEGDAIFPRIDYRYFRADIEESRRQAQKLFRWHAERYFNKLEPLELP